MARPPDASKQQRWLDLLRRWQQSRCSVRAFCGRYGLTQASFYFWRRVLRQRGLLDAPARPGATPPTSRPTAFVKLTLTDDAPHATAVEVVLNERRRLRVPPGFDPATLLQLVRLLEEPAC